MPGTKSNSQLSNYITQAELARLQELSTAKADYESLRQSILARYESNADIEPGPLKLNVTQDQRRFWSMPSVSAVVGDAEAERIFNSLKPKQFKKVAVKKSRGRRKAVATPTRDVAVDESLEVLRQADVDIWPTTTNIRSTSA